MGVTFISFIQYNHLMHCQCHKICHYTMSQGTWKIIQNRREVVVSAECYRVEMMMMIQILFPTLPKEVRVACIASLLFYQHTRFSRVIATS